MMSMNPRPLSRHLDTRSRIAGIDHGLSRHQMQMCLRIVRQAVGVRTRVHVDLRHRYVSCSDWHVAALRPLM